MNITCKIENQNADDFPEITIRKLYQVIFWESNFKTIHIYNALVVGACRDGKRLPLTKNYSLKVRHEVTECIGGDSVPFITHESKRSSLIDEFDAFKPVWGPESMIIQNNNEFLSFFSEVFGRKISTSKSINSNYAYIRDLKKSVAENTTICKIVDKTIHPTEKQAYRIECDEDLDPDIELLSFNLTTINFQKKQNTQLNFTIEFPGHQKFNCPDTSIYFILPVGFDSPEKNLNIEKNGANHRTIVENAFQSLKTDRDKYLKEWIDRRIEERKYYRVIEDSVKSFKDDLKKINSSFRLESIVDPILKQFIFGLAVSLFFSFALDQDRMIIYRNLFWEYGLISPDLNFSVTFGLLTLSSLFKINIGYTPENRFSFLFRTIGLVTSLAWFIWVFFICSAVFYNSADLSHPAPFKEYQVTVSHFLNLASVIFNLGGLALLFFIHRDEINISLKENFIRMFRSYQQ